MFGYIKADKADLSDKDFEVYRSVYCSLCKCLGKEYSVLARFVLNYDCAFYALFALNLCDREPEFIQGRCRFNPFKKCSYCEKVNKPFSLAAALCVSSTYYHIIDNIRDSKGVKKLFYMIIKPLFARWNKKSAARFPEIEAAVSDMMESQLKAESDENCSIDKSADPTAIMLSKVCSLIPENISTNTSYDDLKLKRILSSFGYFLGRWIYLIDASDDFEDDMISGSFNPFITAGYNKNDIEEKALPVLNHSLSEVLLSYGLLDKGRYDVLINSILTSACVKIQKNIFSKYDPEYGVKNEKSI